MRSAIISRDNPPEANASGQTAKGPFTDGNEIVHLIIPIPFRKDRKMKKRAFLIALTTLAFASMACSGTMRGIDRYSGKRVFFSYADAKFGSAEIQVTMPDGERFAGRTVKQPTATDIVAPSGKSYAAVEEFQGNSEAFLQGDRGNNMKCKFRLSDTVLGFKSGGFGLCETSDGRVIDIFTR